MQEKINLPVLAVDLGGTAVKYGWVSEEGRILEKNTAEVPQDTEAILELITALSRGRKVCGIAVSMPGIIDSAAGMVHSGGVYTFLHEVPLQSLLEERTGLPCWIGNDGKCAGLAESRDGSLADVKDGAVIVIGTGVGGCVVLDGRVRDGAHFRAGVFSNMYLRDGQWWDFSSIHGLQEIVARHLGSEEMLNGREIFALAEQEDPRVMAALEEYVRYLAQGIYNIQVVLDLEKYAIGGGISEQPLLCQLLRQAVRELWTQNTDDTMRLPQIVACRYHNAANLLGAFYGWKDKTER